jgi:hypothetical protein
LDANNNNKFPYTNQIRKSTTAIYKGNSTTVAQIEKYPFIFCSKAEGAFFNYVIISRAVELPDITISGTLRTTLSVTTYDLSKLPIPPPT